MTIAAPQTRKERERAEREARILDSARQAIMRNGYHGLNMERIASALGYSKGTIYNHFSCKEEIVIALALETMGMRVDLFRRAAEFRGRSRERLAAIGVAAGLFVQLYPDHFKFEQLIRIDSIWEKTSEKRRSLVRTCEFKCMEIVTGVVRDGVAHGDLTLPADMTAEEMVFGLWALTFGTYAIMTSSDSLEALGVASPQGVMNRQIDLVLDGYGWLPLSSEVPSERVREQVFTKVFPDEFRKLRGTL